ncbi:hypothetical protein GGR52DRAFT_560224 [Hypoxylon sp. FL1284]|nr:hypothetical protein GGR52DRAFT_560224 [Hypoxylon sp. FL1284]
MSLGLRSLWRARTYTSRGKELSLIPREQHNPPSAFRLPSPQRLLSTFRDEKRPSAAATEWRARRASKRRLRPLPNQHVLVRPAFLYPDRRETQRSLHKHGRSVTRLHLLHAYNEAAANPVSNWRATLGYMLRYTSVTEEMLKFRVIMRRGIAAETYRLLSEPDTSLSRMDQRNKTHTQVESISPKTGDLTIIVSGSKESMRRTLIDLVRLTGKIKFVRASDPSWEELLSNMRKKASSKKPKVELVDVNVADDAIQEFASKSAWPKDYVLFKRADEIARPAEWTKLSFERYVSELVRGRVPSHLANSLYPIGPNHQETVVSLLLGLFSSGESRSAASVSALKLAIKFIESSGGGFHRDSRTLFNHADSLGLPMGSDVFNQFLVTASKDRDLNGFDTILKLMVRKGCRVEGDAWMAFLAMIESSLAKKYILEKLEDKKLMRSPSIRHAIGRQMALVDLREALSTKEHSTPVEAYDIEGFLNVQEEKYGVGWMDTMTLHRIVDILGLYGQWQACNALCDLVFTKQIASPDVVLLNTMLTHARTISQQVATLRSVLRRSKQSMPWLRPDDVTNNILFRRAWRERRPNMLRVIWRYGVLAGSTHPKMRYLLTKLLQRGRLSAVDDLKPWEDVIFGRAELAEMRARHPKRLAASHMASKHLDQARGKTPAVPFAIKLAEALAKDTRIHKLAANGPLDTEPWTVEIPLKPAKSPLVVRGVKDTT